MRVMIALVLIAMAFGRWSPTPAVAQVGRMAVGAGVGVAGGGVITLAVIVARARFQNVYIESADDLIHWQSLPMILTPAVGAVFGYVGRDALVGSIIGSTSGMVAGALIGAGVGWLASETPESPWAGGVIGAGVGMTLGGLALGIRGWVQEDNEDNGPSEGVRIGVRFRL